MNIALLSMAATIISFLFLPMPVNSQNQINNFYGLWEVYDLSATDKELTEQDKNNTGDLRIHPIIGERLHITPDAIYYKYKDGKIQASEKAYKVDKDGKISVLQNGKWDDNFFFNFLRVYLKKDSDNKIRMLYVGSGMQELDTLTVSLRKQ